MKLNIITCTYLISDVFCEYLFPTLDDPDQTIALISTTMQQLNQLIQGRSCIDLSKNEARTVETLLFIVLDSYLQSEIEVKMTLAELFGEKYIECLTALSKAVHSYFCRCH